MVDIIELEEELVHDLIRLDTENLIGIVCHTNDQAATATVEEAAKRGEDLVLGTGLESSLELQCGALRQREDRAVSKVGKLKHG